MILNEDCFTCHMTVVAFLAYYHFFEKYYRVGKVHYVIYELELHVAYSPEECSWCFNVISREDQ